MRTSPRIVVVGAGIGGLVASLDLANAGCEVTCVERATAPGGKMRTLALAGRPIDAGPTVLTMRWVFEQIFADAGTSLSEHVALEPLDVLARHAWSADEKLDLYADTGTSADAIAQFAGPAEARRYLEFCARARATYETLEKPFILSPQPSPLSLTLGAGLQGFADLWRISPFVSLWSALGSHFQDPRLRQLFGRYATYCGSSPFDAPATLMLVAHVEQQGVWSVQGGMHKLAKALETFAIARGAKFRYEADAKEIVVEAGKAGAIRLSTGECIPCDAVVLNADPAALGEGFFGRDVESAVQVARSSRSLSALTWVLLAETDGFPLARHNVFFSSDYKREFDDIFVRRQLPGSPTVYVCAQDRGNDPQALPQAPERLFALVNAPPSGDTHEFESAEIDRCRERAFGLMRRCGLAVRPVPSQMSATSPRDFDKLFPGTGGALYGQASHGWTASFTRPSARTRISGLYLAGGSTHPGPGVPMAALSGRLAARRVLSDLTSTNRSRPAAMRGGISTP